MTLQYPYLCLRLSRVLFFLLVNVGQEIMGGKGKGIARITQGGGLGGFRVGGSSVTMILDLPSRRG